MSETCGTCRFRHDTGAAETDIRTGHALTPPHECHFWTPTSVIPQSGTPRWPPVTLEEWCGQWQARD